MMHNSFLFLLVGRNPLPNYVAVHLLARANDRIILLHTSETVTLATLLKERLQADFKVTVTTSEVPPAGAEAIRKQVNDTLRDLTVPFGARVLLNYTGGTKPMAVHVYQALVSHFGERLLCSYLRGDDLQFYEEGRLPFNANDGSLKLSIETLAAMHGYTMKVDRDTRQEPLQAALAAAIGDVHDELEGQAAWWAWRQKGFPQRLPDRVTYPALASFVDLLEAQCPNPTPDDLAHLLGYEKIDSCGKWLNSGWLEDVVLAAIRQQRSRLRLTDEQFMAGLKLEPRQDLKIKDSRPFESDVIVVYGFRVFFISCIANSRQKEAGETKKHLFEAYVRARQFGGEEARMAVVCLLDNPEAIENEINREWLPSGGIRVFGRQDLPDLTERLSTWIKQT